MAHAPQHQVRKRLWPTQRSSSAGTGTAVSRSLVPFSSLVNSRRIY